MSYLNRFTNTRNRENESTGGDLESKRVNSASPVKVSATDYDDISSLFPIPPPPQLSKLSEPKPVSRIAPGYDMRTLRKQVDQLHQEIMDRVDSQSQLYSQNEKLWLYMRELLESSKSNAARVRDHMNSLHHELYSLHVDRTLLAEKLRKGQELKSSLDSVRAEFSSVEEVLRIADSKQDAACEALDRAHAQNEQLETSLQGQVERMQSVHSQLDALRLLKREEDALDLAEEHYNCSRCILRAALGRFRRNMKRRIRCRVIHRVLRGIYHQIILRMSMELWQQHRQRVLIAKRNTVRRAMETVHLCLARWKVHSALERHFRGCSRRRTLKAAFGYLREGTRTNRQERIADSFHSHQLRKERARRAFHAWSQQCMFLLWDSQVTSKKERLAVRHYAIRVLLHWRRATLDEKSQLRALADSARSVAGGIRRVFNAWRTLQQSTRFYRDQALHKVFTKLQSMVLRRDEQDRQTRRVVALSWYIRQRGSLRRLQKLARRRQKVYNTLSFSSAIALPYHTRLTPHHHTRKLDHQSVARGSGAGRSTKYGNGFQRSRIPKPGQMEAKTVIMIWPVNTRRRKLFTSVLLWAHRVAKWKRLGMSDRLATLHHTRVARLSYIRLWYRNTCVARRKAEEESYNLKRLVFDKWCVFVPLEQRARRLEVLTEERYNVAMRKRQRRALSVWLHQSKRSRLLKIMEYQTLRRLRMHLIRCHFSKWRSTWTGRLMWREKEARIEAKRSMALVDLRTKELEDLSREKDTLRSSMEDVTMALDRMNAAVVKKDEEIALSSEELRQREEDILRIQETLKACKERLEDCVSERNRLRVVEEVFDRDREFEDAKQRAAKEAAERTLRRLEEETIELRREVEDARKLTESTRMTYEEELEKDERYLESTVAAASTLHGMVQEKTREVERMEQDRDSLVDAISAVKQKLELTAADMLSDENGRDQELRRMRVEVGSLRSSTMEAESRVQALREAIKDRRGRIVAKQRAEVARNASLEASAMSDIAGNVSNRLRLPADCCPSPSNLPPPHFSHCHSDEDAEWVRTNEMSSLFSGDISSVRSFYAPPSPQPTRSESPSLREGLGRHTDIQPLQPPSALRMSGSCARIGESGGSDRRSNRLYHSTGGIDGTSAGGEERHIIRAAAQHSPSSTLMPSSYGTASDIVTKLTSIGSMTSSTVRQRSSYQLQDKPASAEARVKDILWQSEGEEEC